MSVRSPRVYAHRAFEDEVPDLTKLHALQVSEPDEFGYSKDQRKVFVVFFGTKEM
jgi:hypothetical protein